MCDDGSCLVSLCLAAYLHIQFLGDALLQLYVDMVFADILLALFECFACQILDYLKLIFRLAHKCSQCYSNRQSDHTCTRYAHSHCVFEDIGRQQRCNLFGSAAQCFGSLGHTQRYTHRFGAAYCGHHFAVDERYNLFAYLFFEHSSIDLKPYSLPCGGVGGRASYLMFISYYCNYPIQSARTSCIR